MEEKDGARTQARIRPYRAADAPALSRLYRASVEGLGPRDYSAAQVAAWASLCPTAEQIAARAGDGRLLLVAVGGADRPLAFADLERDGHIDLFYCAPEAAGRGVATALYAELERAALAAGMPRLFAEASETARGFFERQGFAVTARRDFAVAGVPIHNYAVEKRLTDREAQPPVSTGRSGSAVHSDKPPS